ncbi:MAG: fumarylacetoacetate hydrolase family protein [Dehalococcoidia bacterium]|nr:fumarylacetoacetate hydrolase family protein [Dehalococcoidia bacterium]
MKIYQIDEKVVVDDGEKISDITKLRPSIKSSLDLIKVALSNDITVSEYIRKTITKNKENLSKSELINARIPIDSPETWAFGVTYEDSMKERQAESDTPDVYGKVYVADRPEAFFKSTLARLKGPNDKVGIRLDSTWDVPEPELTFIIYQGKIIGFTVGNDMSSRSIEGANPLYIPQAKIFNNSASIGPCWVPIELIDYNNLKVEMIITRISEKVFSGSGSTSLMKRKCDELNDWLHRSNDIPDGTTVMTGTGTIPPEDFTLQEGDEISITIENIGTLVNKVIKV